MLFYILFYPTFMLDLILILSLNREKYDICPK